MSAPDAAATNRAELAALDAYDGFMACPACGKQHHVAGTRLGLTVACPCSVRFDTLTGRQVRP